MQYQGYRSGSATSVGQMWGKETGSSRRRTHLRLPPHVVMERAAVFEEYSAVIRRQQGQNLAKLRAQVRTLPDVAGQLAAKIDLLQYLRENPPASRIERKVLVLVAFVSLT